jgi:hypothetical protein
MANSTGTWPLFGQLAKLCGQPRTLGGYRRDRRAGAHSLPRRASPASPSPQRGCTVTPERTQPLAPARRLLVEARENFARYQLDHQMLLSWGEDTLLFPWAGDRVLGTIAVALTGGGLDVSQDGIALTVAKRMPEEVRRQLGTLLAGRLPAPDVLAKAVHDKRAEKYDWALSDPLLNAAYAARSLDPPGGQVARTLQLVAAAARGDGDDLHRGDGPRVCQCRW